MQSYPTYGHTPLQYCVPAASFARTQRPAPELAGLPMEVRHGAR
jgi:hypothetical protein